MIHCLETHLKSVLHIYVGIKAQPRRETGNEIYILCKTKVCFHFSPIIIKRWLCFWSMKGKAKTNIFCNNKSFLTWANSEISVFRLVCVHKLLPGKVKISKTFLNKIKLESSHHCKYAGLNSNGPEEKFLKNNKFHQCLWCCQWNLPVRLLWFICDTPK